jgi:integrase
MIGRSKRRETVFCSIFAENLKQFVAYKRAQGYKYSSEEGVLSNFDRWCAAQGVREANLEDEKANSWQNPKEGESPKSHSNRVILLSQFAKFLQTVDKGAYVIPKPARLPSPTFVPHIFTSDELAAIFRVVDSTKDSANLPHNREIYPMMFRLLYGCGLRVSEASNLKKADVNCENGIITISEAKYDVDRLIPMSEALTVRMRVYMQKMKYLVPNTPYVFPNRIGENIASVSIYSKFRNILFEAGIPHYGRGKGPRLHDFRHTFAVHSMQKMADEGMDLYCALPILSTYLGHSNVASTEKYLRLTEEMHGKLLEQVFQKYGDIVPCVGKEVRFEN